MSRGKCPGGTCLRVFCPVTILLAWDFPAQTTTCLNLEEILVSVKRKAISIMESSLTSTCATVQ